VRSLRDDRAPAGQGLAAAPKKKPDLSVGLVFLEAWVGIEPAYADLQSARRTYESIGYPTCHT